MLAHEMTGTIDDNLDLAFPKVSKSGNVAIADNYSEALHMHLDLALLALALAMQMQINIQ